MCRLRNRNTSRHPSHAATPPRSSGWIRTVSYTHCMWTVTCVQVPYSYRYVSPARLLPNTSAKPRTEPHGRLVPWRQYFTDSVYLSRLSCAGVISPRNKSAARCTQEGASPRTRRAVISIVGCAAASSSPRRAAHIFPAPLLY